MKKKNQVQKRGQVSYFLEQAARYAKSLEIEEIFLAFFIDAIDEKSRKKYRVPFRDNSTGVTVNPLFIETN